MSSMERAVRRFRRRRHWERQWRTLDFKFGWKGEGVADEIRDVFTDGWIRPGTTVLDIGCGSGENAAWLAAQGCDVHGIDLAKAAIGWAHQQYPGATNLTFSAVDVTKRRSLAGRTYDALLDRGCFHGLPPELRSAYVANVTRWAKPAGTFALVVNLKPGVDETRREDEVDDLFGSTFDRLETRKVTMSDQRGRSIDGVAFRLRRHAGDASSSSEGAGYLASVSWLFASVSWLFA